MNLELIKKETWSTETKNDGTLFDSEFDRIYENFNEIAGSVNPQFNLKSLECLLYPSYKELKVKTFSASQIQIEWEGLRIHDRYVVNFSVTLDITADLDTGLEENSTWYYIWAAANEAGEGICILSASSDSPVLPGGYDRKRLISMVYNNSSGDFVEFVQGGNKYYYNNPQTYLSNIYHNSSIQEHSLETCVPEKVKVIQIYSHNNATSTWAGVSAKGYINGQWIMQFCINYGYGHCHVGSMEIVTTNRKIQHYCHPSYPTNIHAGLLGFTVEL